MTKPMHLVIAGTPLEASLLTAWFRNSYTTEDLNITLVTEASSVRQRVHQLNYKNLGVISHLGLDEKAFMKLTAATFNLGTWHKGWLDNSHHYFQPFGTHGGSMDFVSFQHYLFKRRGIDTDISYEDYSLSCVAAYKGKFTHPKSDQNSIASTIGYSLAIDEQVTVRGLLDYFSNVEVTYHDASVSSVSVSDGVINALELSDGSQLSADIYLDCTGTERLLIKELP
ncbi:MAG: tryptophan 7-halogenase, partial [Gammaproteobacteria bacterium]